MVFLTAEQITRIPYALEMYIEIWRTLLLTAVGLLLNCNEMCRVKLSIYEILDVGNRFLLRIRIRL